jgi:hypothetical protein
MLKRKEIVLIVGAAIIACLITIVTIRYAEENNPKWVKEWNLKTLEL